MGHFLGIVCGYKRAKLKNKFTEGNARKLTVSFAFCAHIDVIKIEKH